jgi:hypothetical protein
VGWLSVRFDNGLLAAIFWLLAGLGFVWIASHLPFDWLSRLVGWLQPDLAGLQIYPFVIVARLRMSILYFVVGVMMAIGGSLGLFVIETATQASSAGQRWLALVVGGVLIFGLIGLVADDLINKPLRTPVVTINELIVYGRKAQVEQVSKEETRQMGLRALRPFGDLIYQPYRLILGNYDPETITETAVYVDFNGTWGACFLIGQNPMYCQLSSDLYLQRLACLMEDSSNTSCRMNLTSQGQEELNALVETVGQKPKMNISTQYGNSILVDVSGEGKNELCYLRAAGDIYFERCKPFAGADLTTSAFKPTVAPQNIPSPFPTLVMPTSSVRSGLAALIPEYQADPPVTSAMPRYNIDVQVDYAGHSLRGDAQVEYTNAEAASLGEVYFRLLPNGKLSYGNGSLKVNQVLLNGQPAETELSEEDTVLKVKMPRQLMPGSVVQFDLEFYGVIPENFGGDETPAGYGIYNISEGVMALASWYPILAVYDESGWNLDPVSPIGDSVYSDMALYSVSLSVPDTLVVAATGIQTERQVVNGRANLQYESGPVRDFFVVASPDFEVVSTTVGDTRLNSYYLGSNQSGGKTALEVGADSLRIYSQQFGLYPYVEMDIVDAPMRNAQGVEYPGIVLIGDQLYAEPDKPDFAITVAHEMAHQWWYNVVGNDVFDEPWLDEALATYSSSLYYEFELDPAYLNGLVDYWQGRYDQLVSEGKDDQVTRKLSYFEKLNNPSIYGTVVYVKGALFFRALRQRIGDEAFFDALKVYYRKYRFKIATGQDLLDEFEQTYHKQLDAFYQVWLYSKR